MTLQHLRICVVGAGIAGLACALAAVTQGMTVQLVDEAALPRHLPASIDVVPGMLRDLAALGVADDCVRAGFAYHGIDVLDRQGRRLFELPTERLAGPRWPAALGIAHGVLHALLARAARQSGAELLRGQRVESIEEYAAGRARVVLVGDRRLEADIVLLATGARSLLRATLFPTARAVEPLGQVWHYALVQRPRQLDRPLVAMGGPGHRAMLLPVHHDAAGVAVTEPASAPAGATPAAQLRRALQVFAPAVSALAAHIHDDTPVAARPVLSGVLDGPWHRGPVLAVGDGAHALPPHFGQAAAQSVEDARVLADLLPVATDRDTLFRAFEQRRSTRARLVHEIASTAARWDLRPDSAADLGQLMQRLMRTVAQPA
jgi:2-polyprenyl-6-methoxyphenol hydroxylase-like FAD-dependent oxidoreductase